MVGVITGWDILAHPMETIRCFGWHVFFRAVTPWQHGSFLSRLQDTGFFGALPSPVPRILERCIDLELRAKQIYDALAHAFDGQGLVRLFFVGLAEEEQHHAELLEVVRAASMRSGWNPSRFNPWEDYLPRLERQNGGQRSGRPWN